MSHFLSEGATLATQNKTYSKVHQFNGNYDDRKKSSNKPTCEHCDKECYTKTVCYKQYGYPPKWQEPSQSNQRKFNKAKAAVTILVFEEKFHVPLIT